jgi:hypothetical protein
MSNRAKRIEKESNEQTQLKSVDVYIGVFFEGTGNHRGMAEIGEEKRAREEERLKEEKRQEEQGITVEKDTAEYKSQIKSEKRTCVTQKNAVSNVGILENLYDKTTEKYAISVNIEGTGISEEGYADYVGLAIGTGDYGTPKKVERAITEICKEIKMRNIPADKKVNLYIDVFGFSRGAASARFFIHQVTGIKRQKIADNFAKGQLAFLIVNFVGLYDTVSSYGFNFDDDVKDLKLDTIRYAKKVFQICAADEFREKFSLTNINSAGDKGVQIFLPGCHTDIGGGYPNGKDGVEEVCIGGLEWGHSEPDDLLEVGYDLCSLTRFGWIGGKNTYTQETEHSLFSSKKTYKLKLDSYSPKGYSNLTLELMKEYANGTGRTMFEELKKADRTPTKLEFIKEKAFDCKSIRECRKIFYDKYMDLTQDWLHFSSKGGIAFSPRVENKLFKRKIING